MISETTSPDNLVQWSKFCTFFKVDTSEIWTLMANWVEEYSHKFTVDELLTLLVNIAHSLSVDSGDLFDVANIEFCKRMSHGFETVDFTLQVKGADIIKILETLNSFGWLDENLGM